MGRAGRLRVVRRDRLHRRRTARASACFLLDAAHVALARAGRRSSCSPSAAGGRAAPVAIAVAPLVLVFLPVAAVSRAGRLPHLDRRVRVPGLDRGGRSRSFAWPRDPGICRSSAGRSGRRSCRARSRSSSSRSPPFTRRRRFPAATSRTTSSSRRASSTTATSRSRTTTGAATIAPTWAAICRRTSIRPRARWRDVLDPRARRCRRSSCPAFAIGGYHGVVDLPDPARLGRVRAGLVARVADDRQRERGVVRLGRRHACRRRFSSRATPSFPTARARRGADRILGAAARGLGVGPRARDSIIRGRSWCRGCCTAPRSRCCRGCTRGSPCLPATLGGLILVRLARAPNPFAKASAFLAVPAVRRARVAGFFLAVYGTPDPTAPYGGDVENSLAFLPNGLGGLLFDQGFGLLATAPVLVVAFAGFARTRRLALEWLVVAVPYLLAVAHLSRCGGPDRAVRRVSWCRCCCRWRFRPPAAWARGTQVAARARGGDDRRAASSARGSRR